MDFIETLPRAEGKEVVMVVVDRLTKYSHFASLPRHYNGPIVAKVHQDYVGKLHGIPHTIVCDRDSIFLSNFWKELMRLAGTKIHYSTTHHPQTDGQSEVVNRTLETYLRCFMGERPTTWVRPLAWAEWSYNSSTHSTIGISLYEVLYGYPPPSIPHYEEGTTSDDMIDCELRNRNEIVDSLRKNMAKAQDRMSQVYNKGRKDREFSVGDYVWLKRLAMRQRSLMGQPYLKLLPKYYGPFKAADLEIEAYPLLDEVTSKISTLNLERVRRLKSRLVALTRRVQKFHFLRVRDEIEQLMDDDGDMAEMYLTDKKLRVESAIDGDQSIAGYSSIGAGMSVSTPVSPVSSPTETQRLEKSLSIARSRHESMKSSESAAENIEELEMLLEAYFVVIDSTLNKLTSLKEYIDDTEDFINIQLDNVRNQLIQFELLLTTATFVVAIFGVVAGIFGMNFSISLFDEPEAFKWVLLITGACGIFIFCTFLWFFRHRRLMPL
ncbi:magnesium transporter MRS2-B-like [Nymphaea colorata]|nr:magnesium transporter MRS2-B-like [Nymphaea colorata]